MGSSPLSRGIPFLEHANQGFGRIIPALAGNTGGGAETSNRSRDHPRSRGEYPELVEKVAYISGSSPLSRGIPRFPEFEDETMRIIPALAGNTRVRIWCASRDPDHPRSRGEYVNWGSKPGFFLGSSPLSRGIRTRRRLHHQPPRIIPALAGNTALRSRDTGPAGDHPRSRGEYTALARRSQFEGGSSPLSRGIPHPINRHLHRMRIIPALAGNTRTREWGV